MSLSVPAQSKTWTYVDGDWHEGNVALIGPRSHAMWLGSSVFDGARWFENVAPDLDRHAERLNDSAIASLMETLRESPGRPLLVGTGLGFPQVAWIEEHPAPLVGIDTPALHVHASREQYTARGPGR